MAREIKFRVWDSSLENMIPHDLIVKLQLFGLAIVATSQTQPMQFTGLTDKNSKEIYEGDVVKHGNEIGFVEFDIGKFYVHWVNKTWLTDEIHVLAQHIEIIGNIYENPELLAVNNECK